MTDRRVVDAIEFIREQVQDLERKISQLKGTANQLAVAAGLPPEFEDAEAPKQTQRAIKPDQFAVYSAPSTAARAYFEWRGKDRGAASFEEIHDALVTGGYPFERGE